MGFKGDTRSFDDSSCELLVSKCRGRNDITKCASGNSFID